MRLVTFLTIHQGLGGSSLSLPCREVSLPSFPFLTTPKPKPEVQWNHVSSQLWSPPGLFSSSHTTPTPDPVGSVLKIQTGAHLLSSYPATSRPRHHCLILGSRNGLCLHTAQHSTSGAEPVGLRPQLSCPAPAPWSLWAEGSLHPGRPTLCPVLPAVPGLSPLPDGSFADTGDSQRVMITCQASSAGPAHPLPWPLCFFLALLHCCSLTCCVFTPLSPPECKEDGNFYLFHLLPDGPSHTACPSVKQMGVLVHIRSAVAFLMSSFT